METSGKSLSIWESKLRLRDEKTRKRYIGAMKLFLDANHIDSLETLFQMHLSASKSADPRDRNLVENLIYKHFMWLQEHGGKDGKGIKPQTCLQFIASIRSFFKSQNLPINIDTKEFEIDEPLGRDTVQENQLKAIWDSVATENRLRNRCILAILKDSGIREGDLAELTIKEYLEAKVVEDDLGNKFKVFPLKINEKKRKRMAIHLGNEAIEATDLYLEQRKPFKPQDYLILNALGRKISSESLTNIVKRICSKVAPNLGSHSWRKFHYSTCLGFMQEGYVHVLEGKKSSTYNKAFEMGKLTEKYIQAYDSLRIFKQETNTAILIEQQERIDKLEERIVKGISVEPYLEEMQRMREEMAEMQKELSRLRKDN